jgi:hypothetical protein
VTSTRVAAYPRRQTYRLDTPVHPLTPRLSRPGNPYTPFLDHRRVTPGGRELCPPPLLIAAVLQCRHRVRPA